MCKALGFNPQYLGEGGVGEEESVLSKIPVDWTDGQMDEWLDTLLPETVHEKQFNPCQLHLCVQYTF
jgi:hypothetical protein